MEEASSKRVKILLGMEIIVFIGMSLKEMLKYIYKSFR